MALLKSKLFSGALYAGLLLGGAGEQVPVTPQVPLAGGGISRGIQQYNLAKHVKLSGKTWQEQDTYGYAGIKYDLIAHKVFALGKTGQEQVSVGSITSTNLVNVYKADRLVSVHYRLNVATAQNQSVSGSVSVSNFSSPILADNSIETPNLVIGLQETSQVQQTVGRIISKQTIADVELVSVHLHASAITAQVQESSGKVTVTQYHETPITSSVIARTYQQQTSFGKVTTGDDEMLQVLLALLTLDEILT